MGKTRRPKYPRTDANQKENIAALEKLGFLVWDISKLGGDVASDLMILGVDRVSGCERWLAGEGKVPGGKLTPKQRDFLICHPSAGIRFETPKDVLRAFGQLGGVVVDSPCPPDADERAGAVVSAWRRTIAKEGHSLVTLRRLIAAAICEAEARR